MSKIFLSVVIPCYDEMVNLRKGVLNKVQSYLSEKDFSYEVVIVDDGSTDGSIEFAEDFIKKHPQFRLIKNSHTGKAGAVTTGVLDAKGEIILFTDMDQATPIEELDKMLPEFEKGTDIVIGVRSSKRKGAPFSRQVMSSAAILLRKVIIGMPDISDTQCGFKAFRKEVAQKLFKKIYDVHHGFKTISGSSVTAGFDMELLFMATKKGYSITEVPVKWLYVETRRVSPIKDSIEGVLDLVRIKKNALQGLYTL